MSKRHEIMLLWHTIKYLRKKQIFYQIYYRLVKLSANSLVSFQFKNRQWSNFWASPYLFESAMQEDNKFIFFGKTNFIKEKDDWQNATKEKLWLYHLHYLHDLNANNVTNKIACHKNLINQWMINNPPVEGIGWEPYPLSLRIVNLVKWFSRHQAEVKSAWLSNLGMQAQALSLQIEYHILGNHLFVNGKALIFAGAYLEGKSADKWLNKGLEIIDKEIQEQFLADGGHFELSPMYHANLLWDVCDLYYLSQLTCIDALLLRQNSWIKVIEKGLFWLEKMSHPDGEISFFNDAAFGMAPTLQELIDYAKQIGIPFNKQTQKRDQLHFLPNSGYCIFDNQNEMKAIIDLAKIGADYQPGHGHADILSFELSLFGQRFLVNSGTSEYGEGVDRQHQRSTLAHNTVCVNNQNSSVLWSGFRVAQRALPKNIEIKRENELIKVSASHTGYERSPVKVTHQRQWIYSEKKLLIVDRLIGSYQQAEARFYFHPKIKIISSKKNILQCFFPQGQVALFKIIGSMDWLLSDSYWYPEFGKKQPNQCLSISLKKEDLIVEITW